MAPFEGGVPLAISRGGGISPVWSVAGDTIFYRVNTGSSQEISFAALSLEADPRVTERGSLTATAPLIEAVTLPAQFDIGRNQLVFVGASSGGNRIVVRTHFLPSSN